LGGCGVEIFVEDCGTYDDGEGEHYELGWYDLLLLVLVCEGGDSGAKSGESFIEVFYL
jgi:hypothetical protein